MQQKHWRYCVSLQLRCLLSGKSLSTCRHCSAAPSASSQSWQNSKKNNFYVCDESLFLGNWKNVSLQRKNWYYTIKLSKLSVLCRVCNFASPDKSRNRGKWKLKLQFLQSRELTTSCGFYSLHVIILSKQRLNETFSVRFFVSIGTW